jgi:prepilin-type N-terminal cleavage/methylation domain-containing protein
MAIAHRKHRQAGLTLVEVMVSLAISGLVIGGTVSGYLLGNGIAERSVLSLAATARALDRIEATKGAGWDTLSWPVVDQLVASNFPPQTVILDRSGSGQATTYATNYTQISEISASPPLRRIRVDCVWCFRTTQPITNSVETFRAPEQ